MYVAVKISPTLDYDIYTEDGKRGWNAEWFAHESDDSMTPVAKPIRTQFLDETRIFIRCAAVTLSACDDEADTRSQHILS